MILVLGSTGTVGGEVARQLIAAGEKPRLLVRDKGKAKAFEGKAEIVEGDLDRPDTLAPAMKGIDKLFLLATGTNMPELEAKAIDAAKKAGVKHVVKLSVISADTPQLALAKWHAQGEKHLVDSGLAWTMIRPGNFHTNALGWASTIKSQGAFYQPTGEGKWASVDPADIAAVAVKALTAPGHEGKAYTLTGPESLTAAQYAAKLSTAIGKPVKFVDVPPAAAEDGMSKLGMPKPYVSALLELMAAMKAGHTDYVGDDVQKVLGRKATSFEDWAKKNLAAVQ
ncbi:MAG: SDR family oxidoreductase [Polyangiales bacterium]